VRAAERDEVIQLYAHSPGGTVPRDKLDAVIARSAELGLDFVTYDDLDPAGTPRGGVALSFDDTAVEAWVDTRPVFTQYDVQATFFVSRYDTFDDDRKALLRSLSLDGHAIEAHSILHLRATDYVEKYGLAAYLADEALPSIELLRGDGYGVSAYAYPFGARTRELDRALLEHVDRVRAVTFTLDGPLIADPCPE
jgi:peptidoglycan/xylan/chitin deacetylase (PgdA/CDA1 family)